MAKKKERPPRLLDLEPESPPAGTPASSRDSSDQFVDMFMYALTAPFMYFPPWDTVWGANNNKTRALMYRLAHLKDIFEAQQCSEFEAMLYISTATHTTPLRHDWVQIYLWLFNRWNPELAQQNDLKPDRTELNINQQEDLARLRAWIFRTQVNHMKAKMKGARREEVEKEQEEMKASQPKLF